MTNEQLVIRIRAGIDEAENMLQLYKQNKGFIYKTAMKYQEHAEIEDLMQEGYIGLCEAVRHYDADQGANFITYAAFWIKQVMLRYIENCGSTVRIPTHAREWLFKYKKVFAEYKKWYGKDPTDWEMQGYLGISQEKLEDIKKALRMDNLRSTNEAVGDDGESCLEDFVASDQNLEEDACRKLDYEMMKEALWNTVDQLPEEQADVIRKKYQKGMTLREIGESIGKSLDWPRQLEAKAFRTLRIPSKCGKFKSYFEEYISASPICHVGVAKYNRTWTSSTELMAMLRYDGDLNACEKQKLIETQREKDFKERFGFAIKELEEEYLRGGKR